MAQASSEPRAPLSRELVLRAAVAIADADGIEALTMRRLGEAVGAEAMSLYHHVANKGDLLDGIVDLVMAEIDELAERTAVPDDDWQQAMRRRILSAREVMLKHPWAPRLFETRTTMSLAMIRYHDQLVGLMRAGGFSYDLAHHALHALGSRALGFSQELFDPAAGAGPGSERMLRDMADQVPHLVGMVTEIAHDDPDSTIGWCDDQAEFEFALDLLLDGLDRRR
ncbi:TetR/AcrR family transcriptional regulator C-terminal domain-containing protein [Kribbella shirazensis]|uniref:AcrR family transcriptional regulator n=1 Tax=Kribbella shirazensis TaxID=1105143 RepID=A0A7X5VJI0_9ACTN|nr:AcrR family transcriptional regulator [Kribbella shirazensis]